MAEQEVPKDVQEFFGEEMPDFVEELNLSSDDMKMLGVALKGFAEERHERWCDLRRFVVMMALSQRPKEEWPDLIKIANRTPNPKHKEIVKRLNEEALAAVEQDQLPKRRPTHKAAAELT